MNEIVVQESGHQNEDGSGSLKIN
jgi:hypothetical protein